MARAPRKLYGRLYEVLCWKVELKSSADRLGYSHTVDKRMRPAKCFERKADRVPTTCPGGNDREP